MNYRLPGGLLTTQRAIYRGPLTARRAANYGIFALFILCTGCKVNLVSSEYLMEKYVNETSHFVTVDRVKIHYQDEGKGYPLLLIHGLGASLQTWDKWTAELSGEYRIIRLDLPGFGLSDSPPLPAKADIRVYGDYLDAFLDSLGISSCHVAGNSLGGWIAWEFAVDYPGRVNKLALLDAAGYLGEENAPKFVKSARKPAVQKFSEKHGVPREAVKVFVKKTCGKDHKVTREQIDLYYDISNRLENRIFYNKLINQELQVDPERVKLVKAPTLILWGRQDKIVPVESAYRFEKDIPENTLIIYEGVGHIPMEEVPGKSAADLSAFLKNK